MNPLRRIAALPLALLVLWTMVVAPLAMAKCVHACGTSHLHAIGALCDSDTGGDICSDKNCLRESHGKKSVGECKAFESDDATLGNNAPLKVPGATAFIVAYTTVSPVLVRQAAPVINANRPQGPPDSPPRETHGRGALPMLI